MAQTEPPPLPDEADLQREDRELRRDELNLRREQLQEAKNKPPISRANAVSLVVALVTAAAAAAAATVGAIGIYQNTNQFERTSRATYFKSILDGLGSQSSAVQSTSFRLLTEFVKDTANYDDEQHRDTGVGDAIQTFVAAVHDKSPSEGGWLQDYQDDLPVIATRAMTQIKTLDNDATLGSHGVDLSNANLHGIDLENFAPNGTFIADATDFRRAILNGLDLSKQQGEVKGAFFTCASLVDAALGPAIVDNADFTGADLSGADLSMVTNSDPKKVSLTPQQLVGAKTNDATKLPPGVTVPSGVTPWRDSSANQPSRCPPIVEQMTGMVASQGYASSIPCPTNQTEYDNESVQSPQLAAFKGGLANLFAVCSARSQG